MLQQTFQQFPMVLIVVLFAYYLYIGQHKLYLKENKLIEDKKNY